MSFLQTVLCITLGLLVWDALKGLWRIYRGKRRNPLR